jgi:hypothetical protein
MKSSTNYFRIFNISLIALLLVGCNNQPEINTGLLFEEMIDMVNLSEFPNPTYKTIQFSSYDRRSKLPGGPDWFANSDGFGGEPIPNFEEVISEPDSAGVGEYLIADIDGPGAIVRVWTAAIGGNIKMFLDGSSIPVFDGSADKFFHRPYEHFNEFEKINTYIFKKTVQQRDASYAPIAFHKHLRIVWKGKINEIHFYQLQVRIYENGTLISTFQPKDIKNYAGVINKTSMALYDPDQNLNVISKEEKIKFAAKLASSDTKTIIDIKGQKAIEQFTIQLNAENVDLALRQTILHIICDNYPWGQVQSPIGDFFGVAPGINPYNCLPFTVWPDGSMICRFIMPFNESIKIILENKGDQDIEVNGTVLPMQYTWNDNSMHFRTRWRIDNNIMGHNTKIQDLPFLLANGKGVYIGTTSILMNPALAPMPHGNW